jgi:hypothetical protein
LKQRNKGGTTGGKKESEGKRIRKEKDNRKKGANEGKERVRET